jgi:hypothetical protein
VFFQSRAYEPRDRDGEFRAFPRGVEEVRGVRRVGDKAVGVSNKDVIFLKAHKIVERELDLNFAFKR